ncbi:hypothetical protein HZS_166, partial [Henneguya salminicola]
VLELAYYWLEVVKVYPLTVLIGDSSETISHYFNPDFSAEVTGSTASSLLSVILIHVRSGSIIITYNFMGNWGCQGTYTHRAVNYSVKLIDFITSACANTIIDSLVGVKARKREEIEHFD